MNRVLVAGVGNIFLGDDGFGVEVVRRLLEQPLPEGVTVADFGLRSLDLAYALSDGYDPLILIDTTRQGGHPGQLHVLELSPDFGEAETAVIGPHDFDPNQLFRLAAALGCESPRILLIGCEPESFGDPLDGAVGLSDCVAGAVDEAIDIVHRLLPAFITAPPPAGVSEGISREV